MKTMSSTRDLLYCSTELCDITIENKKGEVHFLDEKTIDFCGKRLSMPKEWRLTSYSFDAEVSCDKTCIEMMIFSVIYTDQLDKIHVVTLKQFKDELNDFVWSMYVKKDDKENFNKYRPMSYEQWMKISGSFECLLENFNNDWIERANTFINNSNGNGEKTREGTVYRAFIEKWHMKGTIVYNGKKYGYLTRMMSSKGQKYALAYSQRDFNFGEYILVSGNAKIKLIEKE